MKIEEKSNLRVRKLRDGDTLIVKHQSGDHEKPPTWVLDRVTEPIAVYWSQGWVFIPSRPVVL